MKRILSGVQPSGNLHIGNYFGAIKQHIEMQEENECFYFAANLHSLTTLRDKEKLEELTVELTLDYLALGLNPEKTTFFVQSDIPLHSECAWILSTVTHMGLLERAHAWKDAKAKETKDPTVGLFTYPILMACDILLYEPDLVPVGQDQKQHIEITRDLAGKFNNYYGETFKLPEAMIKDEVKTIPGTDGQKMSKSYGNTIEIFAPEKQLKKSVMGIVTDSIAVEDPKDPETCNVFTLYKLFANEKERKELAEKYKAGGMGYGDAKKMLLEKILEYFGPAREKRIELESNLDYVKEVINEGNKKAQAQAESVMQRVREACGLNYFNKI